jgi:hypothetical protein
MSILSQSLPCKPRSLAKTSPEMEPPPLELPTSQPKYSPAEGFLPLDEERSLIRYADAEITAEELSSTPAQREMYLSQSCPNWSTFQMPGAQAPQFEMPEETAAGAVAVPGNPAVEHVIEAEEGVQMIGKSPTILESFKMYNQSGSVGLMDEEMQKNSLEDIIEDEPVVEDDDDEAQFSLEA